MASVLIETKAPSEVATPAPGYVEFFYDSTNNNELSYKSSDGVVHVLEHDESDCCACAIQKEFWCNVASMVKKGMMSSAEFLTLVDKGFSATASEITDGAGGKHCTVNAGSLLVPVESVEISTSPSEIAVAATIQIVAAVSPVNATNDDLIYVSSDISKATVSATGLVTGVAVGSATIYVYASSALSKFDTVVITVVAA